jgi:NADH-quinone oxidoreductase subunit M
MITSLLMLWQFDYNSGAFQFEQKSEFANILGLNFFFGVDGMSLLLINLMSFLSFLSSIYIVKNMQKGARGFMLCLLTLQAAVLGSFAALNLLLFYTLFELALVPMYIMIGLWGGENRIYASYKFFIYTLVGSVIFALCIMYLYSATGTLSIIDLYSRGSLISKAAQQWLWIGLFITFAIKIPMFPFHTWLPDAHVQAPTIGSVILAGVLLKLGGYGFLRILLPIFPEVSKQFAIYPMILSVIAIIYASFVAMAQKDMKKMIAYSSIAHMGFVTAGIFSLSKVGIGGAIFQMLSHGFISAALFFCVGSMYERVHTKQIESYGGLSNKMPHLAFFFMVFTLGSIGLPGTSGFIGEFLCLNGIFADHPVIAMISAVGILLSAVYMLGLYKNIMFGAVTNKAIENIDDLNSSEIAVYVFLLFATIALGIFPNLVNFTIEPFINNIINILYVK